MVDSILIHLITCTYLMEYLDLGVVGVPVKTLLAGC